MRSSVSDILTEQTLGRGLRLPFGRYTGIELLDTLEVVAHERYEALLKNAGVINESFVNHRTRAVVRTDASGKDVAVSETTQVSQPVLVEDTPNVDEAIDSGEPVVTTVNDRTGHVKEESLRLRTEILPREGIPAIQVPRLQQTTIKSEFNLADITDISLFEALGKSIASNPEDNLRRTVLSARVVEGADGLRRTELVTSQAADKIEAQLQLLPLNELKLSLKNHLLTAPFIPARKEQRAMASPIIDAFVEGLGEKADELLTRYLDRASARLIGLVAKEQRKVAPAPKFEQVVMIEELNQRRINSRSVTKDLVGKFSRSKAYEGWKKSVFDVEWFDSSTERTLATILDSSDDVDRWVRLQTNDLPILWRNDGREYNPDFIAIEKNGTQYLVESKMDSQVTSDEVVAKRAGAVRWANYVNASDDVDCRWVYVLVSETDIGHAKGSWSALKGLGTN